MTLATDSKANRFTDVAPVAAWTGDADAAYLHYTPNETIAGVEFHAVPQVGSPLVADLSSSILSRPFDFAAHALVYAGAQKNMGPAGLTVVVLREDALRDPPPGTASMLDYRAHLAAPDGMLNTPPTYSIYLLGLVLDWLAEQGGVAALAERNAAKAAALYAYIDGSGFYRNPVAPAWRSRMNVPFLIEAPEADKARLEAAFLAGARAAGLANLEGHRSVGNRAAMTARMLADAIHYPLDKIQYTESIYLSDETVLIQVIKTINDSVKRAMLIGHNPGLTGLANYLGDQPIDNIPTGGVCCMDLKITSWKGIREHGGKLRFFEFPKNHAS